MVALNGNMPKPSGRSLHRNPALAELRSLCRPRREQPGGACRLGAAGIATTPWSWRGGPFPVVLSNPSHQPRDAPRREPVDHGRGQRHRRPAPGAVKPDQFRSVTICNVSVRLLPRPNCEHRVRTFQDFYSRIHTSMQSRGSAAGVENSEWWRSWLFLGKSHRATRDWIDDQDQDRARQLTPPPPAGRRGRREHRCASSPPGLPPEAAACAA